MTARTAAQLKAEFQHTDPQDFANDVADTAKEAASATVAGVAELATDAEAKVGTDTARAVTPANLAAALLNLKVLSFTGRNGAGACTATGAAVGDQVVGIAGLEAASIGGADASFEATVTVINQIQQSSASDLSANHYLVILRPAA